MMQTTTQKQNACNYNPNNGNREIQPPHQQQQHHARLPQQQQQHVKRHPPAQPFNNTDVRMMERGEGLFIGNGIDRGCGVGNCLDRECVGVVDEDRGLFPSL